MERTASAAARSTSVPIPALAVEQAFGADFEQQQIALSALTALLGSERALEVFREQTSHYEALVQALPPLVHESSNALEVAAPHMRALQQLQQPRARPRSRPRHLMIIEPCRPRRLMSMASRQRSRRVALMCAPFARVRWSGA